MTMETVAVKIQTSYATLMTELNNCQHGDEVQVEYNTVRNFNLNDEITILADTIRNMSVNDIYEENNVEEKIADFFKNNIHGEYKNEVYKIRKKNDFVETNDAGFILFDSDNGIKSVYVRNIISVTIDNVKYVR